MASNPVTKLTDNDYLAIERAAAFRSEFVNEENVRHIERIEHYVRHQDDTWLLKDHTTLQDQLTIDSIGVSVALGSIYEGVEFLPIDGP